MGFGWIFAILFWVLVLVAVVALAKWLSSSIAWPGASRRPLDILKERYARGDIMRVATLRAMSTSRCGGISNPSGL
jgi:putative membrane protein